MFASVIIFDFDDTLVHTNVVYDAAKARFKLYMQSLGLEVPGLLDIVNEFDKQLVRERGFVNECFPLALIKAYRYCCEISGREVEKLVERKVADLGWWVFDQPIHVKEGVEEVLGTLERRYSLLLVTKGDKEHQLDKVEDSGLASFFDDILVVRDKTPGLFRRLSAIWGAAPESGWSVGNSIRSDINPALAAGLRAVLVAAPSWDYELARLRAPVPQLEDLRQLPPLLAASGRTRLGLRQRK